MQTKKDKSEYNTSWKKANRDRVTLDFKKGYKEALKQALQDKDIDSSLNKYVISAINDKLAKDGIDLFIE